MDIVLLSGGSGKRLWPLSNDIRSKQFIKLFKDENGNYESMVQRVYRQITSVNKNARVTIATSKSQVSAIRNQLGEKADICVEPCRRDTFPAIALAAAYLHYEKGVEKDSPVVICPVDPYVDFSYFKGIEKLEKLVQEGTANLTLMGIEPIYPSEKYGYIIPETTNEVSKVKEFKEKPTVELAEEYISKGALWNAGVFGFRLGYMIDKAHKMIDFTDYKDLFTKYDSLTKISFDYAVVEREPDIQLIRYAGDWKDIGTWNMMTEVMSENTKGNVIMDDTCVNTQVINELDIPILCMGCKDMVIAASNDGILVSDKEQSGYMKAYVESIDRDAMYAEKSWGTFSILDVQEESLTIKILLHQNQEMTYQSHNNRDEIWNVLSGSGRAIIDGIEKNISAGEVIKIPIGCKHKIIADTDMKIIEVQVGSEISVKDKTIHDLTN